MSGHTPGELYYSDDGAIRSKGDIEIATVSAWRFPLMDSRPLPQEANARRFVTAWNAHDDLVRACKLSLEWLDEVCNPEWDMHEQEGIEARYNIEAALLKAGATP